MSTFINTNDGLNAQEANDLLGQHNKLFPKNFVQLTTLSKLRMPPWEGG
jgi:hypothetical protein